MRSPDELLSGLNGAQRRAVCHSNGPLEVIAGAGTGKTRVLVTRIECLIASGRARPSEICALTFMNDCAQEIAERLRASLGAAVAGQVTGCTSHRLASLLLRGQASRFGRVGRASIWDETEAAHALAEAIAESGAAIGPVAARAQLARPRSAAWPTSPSHARGARCTQAGRSDAGSGRASRRATSPTSHRSRRFERHRPRPAEWCQPPGRSGC